MDFILTVSGELTVDMSNPSGPLLPDLHRGAGVLLWEAEDPALHTHILPLEAAAPVLWGQSNLRQRWPHRGHKIRYKLCEHIHVSRREWIRLLNAISEDFPKKMPNKLGYTYYLLILKTNTNIH